ncbi:hypothetical protein EJ08DRAFT_285311 [Tothia fuscella]|uniref:Uncharacterized protein n=1 Tax=Tothia fuscella TaxID=1048955 RepID=A0A9P4U3J5_9PEZI|nr:hypothetical protein EJ08DRAFT_285311 [Tothia fuscella]
MRQTLTAALDRKPPRNSVRLSKTVQSNQRSPDTRRRSTRVGTESHVTQLTQVEHFDEGDHSFESTSSKSGPTPKRARPRQVFKIPEIRQPQLGVTARKSAKIRNRRLPLRDVSSGRGNLSPLKPRRMSKGSPLKQDNWERNQTGEEDEADLEFGSEILFTSTPFPTNLPQIEDGLDGGESTTMDE